MMSELAFGKEAINKCPQSHFPNYIMKNFDIKKMIYRHLIKIKKCLLGNREDLGFIPFTSHQQKTHSVVPFGNNLRVGCSLTRNSYGVP